MGSSLQLGFITDKNCMHIACISRLRLGPHSSSYNWSFYKCLEQTNKQVKGCQTIWKQITKHCNCEATNMLYSCTKQQCLIFSHINMYKLKTGQPHKWAVPNVSLLRKFTGVVNVIHLHSLYHVQHSVIVIEAVVCFSNPNKLC